MLAPQARVQQRTIEMRRVRQMCSAGASFETMRARINRRGCEWTPCAAVFQCWKDLSLPFFFGRLTVRVCMPTS